MFGQSPTFVKLIRTGRKKKKEKKLQTRHVDIRKLKQRNDDEVYTKKDKTK